MTATAWWTIEDAKAAFNLFCCVYGIGTLGMPGNFARAGPVCGVIALAFMALVNVYASVVCSRVMLKAPSSVKTFADLGEWALGPRGRLAVILSQMGVCLFVPCAFLVLGGTLLDVIIPDAFSPVMWTVLMSMSILPVTFVPTLKEGAGAALAGCIGTIAADFIALGVLVHHLYHASPASIPSPAINFDAIASTFGNLSLAYGAAIVIPDLQRQNSMPERMPRVVLVTMTLVSLLFVVIASTGYNMVGCQIPGNLLFAISGTALGFTASRGAVVLAFMAMQLHITIGFSVILHPAFFYVERLVLGLHKPTDFTAINRSDELEDDRKEDAPADKELIPEDDELSDERSTTATVESINSSEEEEARPPRHETKFIQCCLVRTAIVVALTLVSVALHDHFHDLVDLVGASSVSLSCIILPIACYINVVELGIMERFFCYFTIAVCGVLSIYVTIQSAVHMFSPPPPSEIVFPFCPPTFQTFSYTNMTHYASLPHA
ncbi:unnamed protein product [Aphanomyces euteiches]